MAKRKYVKENNLVKAINTDSLELQKPLVNEYYDINVHNSNMDKIDKGYKQNKNDISNINYELSKTENTKYSTANGIKEFSCKDGYVDNIVIEGLTKILNGNNEEVEAGTVGAKLVSVGQGDKIEVLTRNSDETKQDKKQIPTTLRSLPNGVKDTIEKRGNKYVKVQRCKEEVLSQNSNVTEIYKPFPNGVESQTYIRCQIALSSKPKTSAQIYCDSISSKHDYEAAYKNIFVNGDEYQCAFLTLPVSELNSLDEIGVKTWLSSNPVTVVYELETPQIIELPNFNPQTYSDNTTLLINSGVIQAEADFEVTTSLGSELEVLKGKVSNLDDFVVEKEIYYPTLLNGFTYPYSEDGQYIAKSNDIVTIDLRLYNASSVSNMTDVFRMLPNFAPKDRVIGLCYHGLTGAGNGVVIIGNDCSVSLLNVTDSKDIRINISYMAR